MTNHTKYIKYIGSTDTKEVAAMVHMLFKEKATFIKAPGENCRIMMSVTSLMRLIEDLKAKTGNSNQDQMFIIVHGRGNEEMEIRVTNT